MLMFSLSKNLQFSPNLLKCVLCDSSCVFLAWFASLFQVRLVWPVCGYDPHLSIFHTVKQIVGRCGRLAVLYHHLDNTYSYIHHTGAGSPKSGVWLHTQTHTRTPILTTAHTGQFFWTVPSFSLTLLRSAALCNCLSIKSKVWRKND